MKAKEIKDLGEGELRLKMKEVERELIKLNAQASTGASMKNSSQIKQTKKAIAKILTIINQKKKNGGIKKE